jgi:hypothetical protein
VTVRELGNRLCDLAGFDFPLHINPGKPNLFPNRFEVIFGIRPLDLQVLLGDIFRGKRKFCGPGASKGSRTRIKKTLGTRHPLATTST